MNTLVEKCRKLSLFDWFIFLAALFLSSGIFLKTFFPGALHKLLKDTPPSRYAQIAVALDPRYEWLKPTIAIGDKLVDSLEGRVWAEILAVENPQEGPLKGRTVIRLRVVVVQGDSGPTVYNRYQIRKGERYFFECPQYVFESVIVDWKDVT